MRKSTLIIMVVLGLLADSSVMASPFSPVKVNCEKGVPSGNDPFFAGTEKCIDSNQKKDLNRGFGASGSFVITREKKSRFQRPEDLVRNVPFVRNLIDPIPFSKETTVKLQINEVLIQWNPKRANNYSLRLSSRIDNPSELRLTARKRF